MTCAVAATGLTLTRYREALKRGCLAVAVCASCGRQQAIPADTCFSCGAGQLEVRDHTGAGRVYSWVVNHYAFAEEFAADTPYTVLLVALEGGGRAYGRLATVSGALSELRGDTPVELDGDATRDREYPVWRLAVGAVSVGS